MTNMPWIFIWLGVLICTPEFLWWLFVSRPKQKRIEQMRRRSALYWRIRNLEMDLYKKWLS